MSVIETRDKARGSLVRALTTRGHEAMNTPAGVGSPEREAAGERLPLAATIDLDQALDDVIERFPKTLRYLAK